MKYASVPFKTEVDILVGISPRGIELTDPHGSFPDNVVIAFNDLRIFLDFGPDDGRTEEAREKLIAALHYLIERVKTEEL